MFQQRDIEIDEEAYFLTAQFQITQQLCLMNRGNLINRFEFHNYLISHKKIDPIANVDINFFITDRKWNLVSSFQTPLL